MNWYLDELPVIVSSNKRNPSQDELMEGDKQRGYYLGHIGENNSLDKHDHFEIIIDIKKYNDTNKYEIVGFEIIPIR
jgi:hypothetical protein